MLSVSIHPKVITLRGFSYLICWFCFSNWPWMSWRDSRSTTRWSCCSSSRRCKRRRSIRTRFRRSKGESTSRLRESPAGASDRSRVRAGGEACPQGPSWLGREWQMRLLKKNNFFLIRIGLLLFNINWHLTMADRNWREIIVAQNPK